MTSFVHTDFPTEHAGLTRVLRGAGVVRQAWRRSAHGSLALAGVVAGAVVLANELVDTWTDGHLLAAWIVMWAVAFGALAIFAAPLARATKALSAAAGRWNTRRKQAAEDRRVWELALEDARVMADISRGMDSRSLPGYY
ncbi:hypothetical protein [Ramlibacter rhizophilus]|uniref:Uncharacterized protein n=1 Tax=Ramlibacter rhizophilus TaxID=1781167 RepID=A0A4Z0BGZ5_9BURK|nr:hypothetical protein [Ramlibacter rhizophilus]TFY98021.1 hypothetical protein EZ242_16360 [Ramlibacter rhizophilus]